jgi:mannose-6-phosphate isomerase-like protein (cupin superfamily)
VFFDASFSMPGEPLWFTLAPGLIFGVIIVLIGTALVRGVVTWMSNNTAPVRSVPARVLGKRTNTWGGAGDSSVHTSYYVAFELDSGERLEFRVNGPEYGLIADNEEGILTYQGTRFKGFQPQPRAKSTPRHSGQSGGMPLKKISKGSAEHYVWGERCDGWHLVKGSDLSVIHERMPAGTAEVRHYHERSRQFFFVLSGTAVLEVDGVSWELHPHEGMEVPPGVPHQMKNESGAETEFLVISQPTSRGDRVLAD